VEDVFKRVRASVMRDSQQQQVPWESSSITGDFYFNPGSGVEAGVPTITVQQPSHPSQAMMAHELRRDGRFIAYTDGTVLDTSTDLMWAARDNGFDLDWGRAKAHCESFRGGGHSDWRMPTQDDLAGLYDARKPRPSACNRNATISVSTELIDITCLWVWASESRDAAFGNNLGAFRFNTGERGWLRPSEGFLRRALPVRSTRAPLPSSAPTPANDSGPGQAWRKDLVGLQMAMLGMLDESYTRDKTPSALLELWQQIGQALSAVANQPESGDSDLAILWKFTADRITRGKAQMEGTAQEARRKAPLWKDEYAELQVLVILRSNIELDETALSAEAALESWTNLRQRLDRAPRTSEDRNRAYDVLQKRIADKLHYWTSRFAQEVAGNKS